MTNKFKISSKYSPSGDQPKAIKELVDGVLQGEDTQTLLGITGSGKTFTIANVIAQVDKPTLVLAHNKTLAGQLYAELKELFPNNHVEYFVSYYDYYQPEAYVASKDLYIEKDASINDDIDQMRHSAVSSLLTYDDVIVVASVSCIYGIGDPNDYKDSMLVLKEGMSISRKDLFESLIKMQYARNDFDMTRGTFRVRGDTLEIRLAYTDDYAIRVEFFGDEIDRISEIHPVTGAPLRLLDHVAIYPASHYVTPKDKLEEALRDIEAEMEERVKYFEENGKLIEAQRIRQRTEYDIEMLREIGVCKGIEQYSRVLSCREKGRML